MTLCPCAGPADVDLVVFAALWILRLHFQSVADRALDFAGGPWRLRTPSRSSVMAFRGRLGLDRQQTVGLGFGQPSSCLRTGAGARSRSRPAGHVVDAVTCAGRDTVPGIVRKLQPRDRIGQVLVGSRAQHARGTAASGKANIDAFHTDEIRPLRPRLAARASRRLPVALQFGIAGRRMVPAGPFGASLFFF